GRRRQANRAGPPGSRALELQRDRTGPEREERPPRRPEAWPARSADPGRVRETGRRRLPRAGQEAPLPVPVRIHQRDGGDDPTGSGSQAVDRQPRDGALLQRPPAPPCNPGDPAHLPRHRGLLRPSRTQAGHRRLLLLRRRGWDATALPEAQDRQAAPAPPQRRRAALGPRAPRRRRQAVGVVALAEKQCFAWKAAVWRSPRDTAWAMSAFVRVWRPAKKKRRFQMTGVDDFDALSEPYHQALHAIINGDPDVYKAMYSDGEDGTLANPFGGVG